MSGYGMAASAGSPVYRKHANDRTKGIASVLDRATLLR
jgi:hypothetical protein